MPPSTRVSAAKGFTTDPTPNDPHRYQTGFGNRFASEAVPNVLPSGRNVPQKVKYDLYSEQLNGSCVIASRHNIRHVWMYRIRPSVAHGDVEPSKQLNPEV
jgi:homogentisate 1,2-dioxygenase